MDILCIFTIFAHFAFSYLAWSWHEALQYIPVLCFLVLLCCGSFVCACITHNSLHSKTFYSPLVEGIYHNILSITFGHPVATFVPGHNIGHHRYTQNAKDSMRTSKMRYKWHFLNLLLFQTTVSWNVFMTDLRYMLLQRSLGKSLYTKACLQVVVLVFSHGIMLYTNATKFILYVYVPHLFAQWGIVTMNMLQHDGCDITDFTAGKHDNYNIARNFTGTFINMVTFNNGFHTIHHFYPTLHWSLLKKEHCRLVKPHIHPNLDHPNMAVYIFQTFIYPGKRVHYLGHPLKFDNETEPPDEDWTIEHTPKRDTLANSSR